MSGTGLEGSFGSSASQDHPRSAPRSMAGPSWVCLTSGQGETGRKGKSRTLIRSRKFSNHLAPFSSVFVLRPAYDYLIPKNVIYPHGGRTPGGIIGRLPTGVNVIIAARDTSPRISPKLLSTHPPVVRHFLVVCRTMRIKLLYLCISRVQFITQ